MSDEWLKKKTGHLCLSCSDALIYFLFIYKYLLVASGHVQSFDF